MAMVDKDKKEPEKDQFAEELEKMFSGKLKTHKRLEKRWNRSKRPGQSDSSSDNDGAGPGVPKEYKSKNLGEQLKILSKEEEQER